MLYAIAMLASVALVLVNAFFVAAAFAIVKPIFPPNPKR
jgi:hypothetical protein